MTRKILSVDTLANFAVYLRLLLLGIVFFICVIGAFMTRYDEGIPEAWLRVVPVVALIWAATQCLVMMMFGVHASLWSFTSSEELVRLGWLSVIASGISSAFLSGVLSEPIPRSIYLISALYSLLSVSAVRFLFSSLARHLTMKVGGKRRIRVLIYGADRQGVGVLSELSRHCPDFHAVGFVGDLPVSRGRYIAGLRVLGSAEEISELLPKHEVDMILASSRSDVTSLRKAMKEVGASNTRPIQVITSISDEVQSNTNLNRKSERQISFEERLGRSPIKVAEQLVQDQVSDRVVMVTGASGSVGSELCRQIAGFNPTAIVAFDLDEDALFSLEREVQQRHPGTRFIPCIGDIRDADCLSSVLAAHRPSVVYDAASHKGECLTDRVLFDAIGNNIFETETLLKTSVTYRVNTFLTPSYAPSREVVDAIEMRTVFSPAASVLRHDFTDLLEHREAS